MSGMALGLCVRGVDFTSAPGRRKPIACVHAELSGDDLHFVSLDRLADFAAFEAVLSEPGPWVSGLDFPFSQSRRFVRNMGWPTDWIGIAELVAGLSRSEFREILETYKSDRAPGDREHQRVFEQGTGAASPQKLYGVPVALMFFEGVPRLRRAGLHLPGLVQGDPTRMAVEAYPGVAARALLGSRRPYKSDSRARQTPALLDARLAVHAALTGDAGFCRFGLRVHAPADLAKDPSGDALDALICAVQAAWAHRALTRYPRLLADMDPLEGWIADPSLFDTDT